MRATSGTAAAEFDIVAMRSDGQERLVRHLSSSILPAGRSFRLGGIVSEDGWLAVATFVGQPDKDFAYALIDLANPAREPQLEPSVHGAAWGPGGLFATAISCCWRVEIVDAETGSRSTQINAASLPGGGPDIIWAADGSGLLVANAGGQQGMYGIAPITGGPAPIGIPPLAQAPRMAARDYGAGNARILSSNGSVETLSSTGVLRTWYAGELAPATLLDRSYSADGRSIWLLFDRADDPRHVAVIAREDAPGAVRVVATVERSAIVSDMMFGAMAPDDSTIVLSPVTGPSVLVTPTDGTMHARDGDLIGFVPGALADTWPGGGTFSPVPDATAPPASAGPSPRAGQ